MRYITSQKPYIQPSQSFSGSQHRSLPFNHPTTPLPSHYQTTSPTTSKKNQQARNMPSRCSRRSGNASNSRSTTYPDGFHSTPNGWYYSNNWFSTQNSGRPRYMDDMANHLTGQVMGGAGPRNNGGHRESYSVHSSQSYSARPSQSRPTRTEPRSTRQPEPRGGNFLSRGLAGLRLFRALNNSGRTGRR
jgi:hypothetical protein